MHGLSTIRALNARASYGTYAQELADRHFEHVVACRIDGNPSGTARFSSLEAAQAYAEHVNASGRETATVHSPSVAA